MQSIGMTLGALIRERRLRNGWTQPELADRIGVDRAYVSQIETGGRKWPREFIADLSQALGTSQVEMAVAAGLIDPPTSYPTATAAIDPEVRAIAERLARLTDRERSHVLDVLAFLEGGSHGAPARRPDEPRAKPTPAPSRQPMRRSVRWTRSWRTWTTRGGIR